MANRDWTSTQATIRAVTTVSWRATKRSRRGSRASSVRSVDQLNSAPTTAGARAAEQQPAGDHARLEPAQRELALGTVAGDLDEQHPVEHRRPVAWSRNRLITAGRRTSSRARMRTTRERVPLA